MFGGLTSLTGGGGLQSSSSSGADGDNYFTNGAFNYNENPDNTGLYVVGGLALLAVLFLGRK